MTAKVKCSNCGEEMTNLTFSWGEKQWLWVPFGFLPLLFFIIWMNRWMFPNGDFASEIEITHTETRVSENRIDVLGKLRNVGDHTWKRVTLEAEFFDQNDRFLDETSEYMSVSLSPGSEEHFRVTLANPTDRIANGDPKVVLKVTDANLDRF